MLITYSGELFGAITPINTIAQVHKDLFPDNKMAPNQNDINASYYLNSILNHSRITNDRKRFIRNGVKWLNEESTLKYRKMYTKLSSTQRQTILRDISKTNWGESWLDIIMTYLLEAMLGDPIYGGNRAESGWKWLKHTSGFPRPKKAFL
ncbi:MAG: gluconate 2-dehydrogenase subunit 3 family protein [Sulfurimonas sp.]|nr:gluconate 2-dehydrogenase subunit 3 family protein [Sulfurimonas sp.]